MLIASPSVAVSLDLRSSSTSKALAPNLSLERVRAEFICRVQLLLNLGTTGSGKAVIDCRDVHVEENLLGAFQGCDRLLEETSVGSTLLDDEYQILLTSNGSECILRISHFTDTALYECGS